MVGRHVRIEGDPELYEVLAETPTTILLVNPAARERRRIETLERELLEARARLADRGDLNEASP